MKAVRYHSYGDSGVLVYEDADRPVAGTGQDAVDEFPHPICCEFKAM